MAGVKDFSCVGGLEKHIRIVKEMVLFPLMYGDVYAKFNLRPPRGLLFYGPPGTGKTLVARALAVECSSSARKVHFISRKGSDCLSKYVGDSEKKLQSIFKTAQQNRPCIIFFDEVDGLAPVRSDRQDFVHASVVSVLLALMDGLDNSSEIVVIGTTNRLDAIDPALRRPGRFDRELYFPLPCYAARKDILSIHVKSWKQKPPQKFISYLASNTVGFCGCDLQALCTEAVMCCLRRNYPQIYSTKSKYHVNQRSLQVEKQDFIKARQNIVPASHRVSIAPVKTLSGEIFPLLQDRLARVMASLNSICPAEMTNFPDEPNRVMSHSINGPRMLLYGTDDCHTRHLAPAVLHSLEHLPCHILDVTALFEDTGRAAEESIIKKFKAARHTLPSLLYVPDVLAWWDLVDETARMIFTSLVRGLDRSVHVLVLVTAQCNRDDLPLEFLEIFNEYQGEMHETEPFTSAEREAFFYDFFRRTNKPPENSFNPACGEPTEPQQGRTRSCTLRRSRSATSATVSSNGSAGKRDHPGGSGDGPPSKRQRSAAFSPKSKLSEPQVQDLVRKAVDLTEAWSCMQLENLVSCLDWTVDNQEAELFDAVNECLTNFEKEPRCPRKEPKVEQLRTQQTELAAGDS